ncbi:MAG: hypothetical protein M0Z94_11460 [Dehalococcoidales bacterium]|nr:hypothetical protein [Dehalococcoidales bacterium]
MSPRSPRAKSTGKGSRPSPRRSAPSAEERGPDEAMADGLYAACLDDEERQALERALAAGLDEETALLRVLIRRALLQDKPATQVAYLVQTLSQLLKTRHVIAGQAAKQLDEALAQALDAIAAEMGAAL